jgi:hypothetical protein
LNQQAGFEVMFNRQVDFDTACNVLNQNGSSCASEVFSNQPHIQRNQTEPHTPRSQMSPLHVDVTFNPPSPSNEKTVRGLNLNPRHLANWGKPQTTCGEDIQRVESDEPHSPFTFCSLNSSSRPKMTGISILSQIQRN